MPQKFQVDLEPVGRRIEVDPGINILSAAQLAGIDLVAACGGVGICGTCRVRLIQGELSAISLTEQEQLTQADLAQGYRLACQAEPLSDIRLEIPRESLPAVQQMQLDGQETSGTLDPAVHPLDVELTGPNLYDLSADLARAGQAVSAAGWPPLTGDLAALRELSGSLRGGQWKARLALRDEGSRTHLAAALPTGTPLLGLAVDLGSTKLAVYLVDLGSAATLARCGVMNPQIGYGEDVVSRIAYANQSPEQRRLLQTRLVDTLNQAVRELCAEAGASPRQVVDAVVVGNTAMHHFFLGLPVEQLGAAPYVPAVSQPLEVRAAEVGLELAAGAQIYLPANIAGYVGGDHTAALLTSQALSPARTWLVADIGTNTEISLHYQGRIVTCSCASGPAFEGAHIRDGMRASPGAIERVLIQDGQTRVSTIAGQPPVGICGSGILQAVAELYRSGIMDARGVFRSGGHPRVRPVSGGSHGRAEFVLVPAEESGHGRDILVTRADVHEIQLAKGAIRAGIEILLDKTGISAGAVDDWVIAGAFGTYLDLASAQRVGMFPTQPLERFHQVGNAAGVGAKQMLISRAARDEANRVLAQLDYIELTTHPDFTNRFVEAMYF